MNKKNNKGFLLTESLIVTTFVLTVLIYLFGQFKNLMTEYKNNYKYNTVQDIYNLGSLAKYINTNNITLENNGEISIIYQSNVAALPPAYKNAFESMANDMGIDYIIYTDSDIKEAESEIKKATSSIIGQDMIDFVEKVKTKDIQNKGRLVARFTNGNFATILIEKNEAPEAP